MTPGLRHAILSVLYAATLSWLLLYEIVPRWSYMLYAGEFSIGGLVAVLSISAVLGLSVPTQDDVTSMLVSSLNYMFFVPSVVYFSFNNAGVDYILSFLILYFCIYFLPRIKLGAALILPLAHGTIFVAVVLLAALLISAQAALGGLRYFNLDLERVYEFRSVAMEGLPEIFGYLFSNTANILIPLGAVYAFKYKKYAFLSIIVTMAVFLFGMTHQKSVIFIPFLVLLIYFCFSKSNSQHLVGFVFLSVAAISVLEIVLLRVMLQTDFIAYFTSYTVRRTLLTPPLLDMTFVEYFSSHENYYWSSSRLGSWAYENPYSLTAPHQIGKVYFLNPEVSANAGVIGSGFAHARIFGVLVYSVITGIIISLLKSHGRRIGHAFVACISFTIIYFVITATDLSTAILSHGLLLLFVILSFFSGSAREGRAGRMAQA